MSYVRCMTGRFAAVLVSALVLSFAGCGKSPPEQAPASVPVPIAPQFDLRFDGTIDTRLKLQMQLRRDGQKLSGHYFYEKSREDTGTPLYLSLDGQIHPDGTFVLTESESGKQTGTFKGKLQRETGGGDPLLRISGSWSKNGESKELPFEASERRLDLGSAFKLKSVAKKEENKKLRYAVDVTLPQLEGDGRAAKFNQSVQDLVSKDVDEFKNVFEDEIKEDENSLGSSLETNYEVTFAGPNFLSVIFNLSSYVAGTAHPNSHTLVLNYDLKAGKVLALSDLFKADSDYLKVISAYCIRSLTKRKVGEPDADWLKRGAGPKIENFRSWNVLPRGMLISFDAYQVASHAEGPQEVFIPIAVLKPNANPAGPLAPQF